MYIFFGLFLEFSNSWGGRTTESREYLDDKEPRRVRGREQEGEPTRQPINGVRDKPPTAIRVRENPVKKEWPDRGGLLPEYGQFETVQRRMTCTDLYKRVKSPRMTLQQRVLEFYKGPTIL